ncbi:uncharacterized protein BYT42DRAFT_279029 [Radiomyces spectabilis]|uniref:uncharacterized protein n=1 Tax=Radiomyces spectabilis TaxID=64574 RepID=UPI00221EBAF1|nr:uncharacterized protein BYT42DRAFT_279029 [Radiomyces spectabilis]KAI8384912.1 hypothetical protein BYT42DRAFT_279029 [Radiomyces spectabilis]
MIRHSPSKPRHQSIPKPWHKCASSLQIISVIIVPVCWNSSAQLKSLIMKKCFIKNKLVCMSGSTVPPLRTIPGRSLLYLGRTAITSTDKRFITNAGTSFSTRFLYRQSYYPFRFEHFVHLSFFGWCFFGSVVWGEKFKRKGVGDWSSWAASSMTSDWPEGALLYNSE